MPSLNVCQHLLAAEMDFFPLLALLALPRSSTWTAKWAWQQHFMGVAVTYYGHGRSIWHSVNRRVRMNEVRISDVLLYYMALNAFHTS